MALSSFSRFQGCLLLAIGGSFLGKNHHQEDLDRLWQPWLDILQEPYQACLPGQFWQSDVFDLNHSDGSDLVHQLIILGLYHQENPLGFQQDLCPWLHLWQKHFPPSFETEKSQNALLLWQRLLTLILSERFDLPQLPQVLKNPDHWWGHSPTPDFSQHLLDDLTAIANGLEKRQSINLANFHPSEPDWDGLVSTAIYLWGKNPAQPRLIFKQLQKLQQPKNLDVSLGHNPSPGLGLTLFPLTLALTGAYNGMDVSQQAFGKNSCPAFQSASLPLLQLLWQRWSGQLGQVSELVPLPLMVSPPLGMQRRSSLKLVSQQDYGQFSSTTGN